jgi:hypothetical protein
VWRDPSTTPDRFAHGCVAEKGGPPMPKAHRVAYTAHCADESPIGYSAIDIFCGVLFVIVFLAFLVLIWHEGHRLADLETSTANANDPDAVMIP